MAQQSFEELKTAVEHATTVKQAALELIHDMGDRLADLADHPSPDEIRALAETLRQHADELAAGISDHAGEEPEEA